MFAVIEIGSSQYRVAPGDVIAVNRLDGKKNHAFDVKRVLLYADKKDIRVGQPVVKDVRVSAHLREDALGTKKISFKFRRRKGYTRTVGHRQKLTAVEISKIEAK